MKYFYLPQYPNIAIANFDNLLEHFKYIKKETNTKKITFIGKINENLYRLELEAFDIISNKGEKRIYYPQLKKLKKDIINNIKI